ncbi:MAG: hypothetical protein JXA91_07985 [Candidatus Thermoplasmatota archaeon]|nr:hypothetical protein [Candidatus Thermoplasmatota archaeon]
MSRGTVNRCSRYELPDVRRMINPDTTSYEIICGRDVVPDPSLPSL